MMSDLLVAKEHVRFPNRENAPLFLQFGFSQFSRQNRQALLLELLWRGNNAVCGSWFHRVHEK
ncbi:hypothetical protein DEM27_03065 [Metarhizobium album]|uniref:Uncharacterized protein n=1 Tax=Metarhizobium album TaxID=2182425 RepID=A0A2U2DXY0_9HYPH|nr:hypothetical protein [Rhizobium album]PWE58174.1 hypothetical protein DEM27_03065 [Rhizobium album]